MIDLPKGAEVLSYLGWPSEPHLVAQADEHAQRAATAVKAYTRSRGFGTEDDTSKVAEDIAGAIVSYAARSLSNPTSAREIDSGSFKASPGSPWSFSLVELLVLNNYRQRVG